MAVYAYAWFRLHLHDCIRWCYMDIALKDLQVHNLKHYPHHSPLTQCSGNPNFEGQRDSFYFYWYSNVKSFMVVGNPCLQSTMALWHCIKLTYQTGRVRVRVRDRVRVQVRVRVRVGLGRSM